MRRGRALRHLGAQSPLRPYQAAARLVARARRLLPGVRAHAYPVWGWTLPPDTEVGPPPRGLRLDVGEHRAAKLAAIGAHRSQVSDLIDDDPEGFCLEPAMLARFARGHEIFLAIPPESVP